MTDQSSQKAKKREAFGAFAGEGGLFPVFVFGVLIQRGLGSERHSAFVAFELAGNFASGWFHHSGSSSD